MKQIDIARAIRAARAEGLTIERIEVESDRVVIVTGCPGLGAPAGDRQATIEARAVAAQAALRVTVRDLIEQGKKKKNSQGR